MLSHCQHFPKAKAIKICWRHGQPCNSAKTSPLWMLQKSGDHQLIWFISSCFQKIYLSQLVILSGLSYGLMVFVGKTSRRGAFPSLKVWRFAWEVGHIIPLQKVKLGRIRDYYPLVNLHSWLENHQFLIGDTSSFMVDFPASYVGWSRSVLRSKLCYSSHGFATVWCLE